MEFAPGYDYPMQRIPPSYSDKVLADAVDGMETTVGGAPVAVTIRSYPAARNSIPRDGYRPVGAVDLRPYGQALGRDLGQRCAGNTACTPICPIQAKYHAGKSLAQADPSKLQVIAQAVASRVLVDPVSGQVSGVEYQRYDDPASPRHTVHRARGRAYVLAAHAVENAKLMLASGLGSASDMVGRNLMDHPSIYGWGLAPTPIGPFRGPLSTSGIDDARGGRLPGPAWGVPGRHRQRRLASDHRSARQHRRRRRAEPRSVRRRSCSATSARCCPARCASR